MSAKLVAQAKELEVLRARSAGLPPSPDEGEGEPGTGQEGGSVRRPCSGQASSSREVALLRAENDSLRAQVEEMTKFIADYGLTWAPRQHQEPPEADHPGGGSGGIGSCVATGSGGGRRRYATDCGGAGARAGAGGGAEAGDEITVNIKVLHSRVEGLNAMLEDDGQQVVKKQVGGINHACLATSSSALPLTFFGDGVKVADWAFMPYTSPTAQRLIKDILDGFFPRTLQEEHPDGVALKVVDRTGNLFKAWLREFARDDPELADGGERLRPTGAGTAIRAPGDERSAGERLLAKLPERAVRNGRVCEVRAAIAEKIGASAGITSAGARARCSPAPVAEGAVVGGAAASSSSSAAVAQGNSEISVLDAGRDAAAPTARLQVKLETGHRITLLMEPNASVGSLWEAMERWRSKHSIARACAGGRQCSLRSAFPPRTYSDRGQTLQAAGLTPSATLFVTVDVPGAS